MLTFFGWNEKNGMMNIQLIKVKRCKKAKNVFRALSKAHPYFQIDGIILQKFLPPVCNWRNNFESRVFRNWKWTWPVPAVLESYQSLQSLYYWFNLYYTGSQAAPFKRKRSKGKVQPLLCNLCTCIRFNMVTWYCQAITLTSEQKMVVLSCVGKKLHGLMWQSHWLMFLRNRACVIDTTLQ